MIIDNLASICSGKLLQKPSITAVTNLTSDTNQVTRGSAFFSIKSSKDDIKLAIQNGAHAIIYDSFLEFDDNEIAYIKVDEVKSAINRLVRYELQRKEINLILCSSLQFDMLKAFKLQFNSYFKPKNMEDFFSLVFDMEPCSYMFLDDEDFLKQIDLKYIKIEKTANAAILQSHTLFRSTFVAGEHFFKEFSLTPFFIPEFSAIILFLEQNSLQFKVESMEKIGHFEPYFVNSNMEKKSFGSTNQVVIVETNEELFEKEVSWIEEKNLNKSTIFLAPYNSKISFTCKRYTSSEILKTIPSNSFRYILILGDKENILRTLEKETYKNPSLF